MMSSSQYPRRIVLWSSDAALGDRLSRRLGGDFSVERLSDYDRARAVVEGGGVSALLADPELRSGSDDDFLRAVHQIAPHLPVALVRAINDCHTFRYLRTYGAAGALAPDAVFPERETRYFMEHLTSCDPSFGLDAFFPSGHGCVSRRLLCPSLRGELLEELAGDLGRFPHVEPHDLQLVFEETLNNAIFHAFRTETNESKYQTHGADPFGEDEELQVLWSGDDEIGVLAVADNQGLLAPHTVWDRFFRQTSLRGLLDTNGRGLYLSHLLSQLLLVTVVPGVRTQVTAIFTRRSDCHDRAVCFRVFPRD